jgi:hypothetical protein
MSPALLLDICIVTETYPSSRRITAKSDIFFCSDILVDPAPRFPILLEAHPDQVMLWAVINYKLG